MPSVNASVPWCRGAVLRRWIVTISVVVSLDAATLRAQNLNLGPTLPVVGATLVANNGASVDEIRFTGLRRISPEALKAQIASLAAEAFDTWKPNRDVQALAR